MLGPFNRRSGLVVSGARHRPHAWAFEPPPAEPDTTEPRAAPRPNIERARFLTHTLLGTSQSVRAVAAELGSAVDERVVAWSPSMYASSRTELVAELLGRDDALTELAVTIVDECVAADRLFVEWRVSGRFTNAAFLDDDVLIEPSYGEVETAGVLVYSFVGERAARILCYHDTAGLLEQVLRPPDPDAGFGHQ